MERKLAVILVADIVGYSAQMERDEAGTFDRVTARRREIFEPAIARHQGRIFKLTGDGLLAEFGSAVQAVECAVALQAGLAERNQALPDAEPILARIGINLGEVIVDGDDRYGEGVNIAARLEQLAEPGGICVSEKVAREVEKKLAFGFEAMGAQKLKNIAEPVQAFRVSNQATVWRLPGVRRSRWLGLGGAILALVIAVIAVLGVMRQTQTQATPVREGPLSIAVLSFANQTGDPERAYIGIALPDNVTVILCASPLLRYTAYVSDESTAQPGGVRAIASDNRVDLVLDGSIGLASPGISFTGRLYDGQTGDVVTSFSVDVPDNDLARLQYLIATKVLDVVAVLTNVPQTSALDPDWAKSSAAPDEYAFFLRGMAEHMSAANSSEDDAMKIYEAGLARYPQSVILRILKAYIHSHRSVSGPEKARWEEAQTALSLLSGLPEASTLPLYVSVTSGTRAFGLDSGSTAQMRDFARRGVK
jgi:class 3 adenylate cyclase/TolB-like protein